MVEGLGGLTDQARCTPGRHLRDRRGTTCQTGWQCPTPSVQSVAAHHLQQQGLPPTNLLLLLCPSSTKKKACQWPDVPGVRGYGTTRTETTRIASINNLSHAKAHFYRKVLSMIMSKSIQDKNWSTNLHQPL